MTEERHELGEAVPATAARRDDSAGGEAAPSAATPKTGSRGSPWRWAWIAVPAVAALLFAVNRYGTQPTRWILWEVRGTSGQVEWNGAVFAPADSNALRLALEHGGEAALGGELELAFFQKGFAALHLGPGTRCSLTAPPKRLGERAVAIRLDQGQVRVATGVRFAGARLTVRTEESTVQIEGTTLGIIKTPEGTRVSAYAGEVTMEDADGTTAVVPVGMRRSCFRDGRPPEVSPLDLEESRHLQEFLDLQRDNLHE